MKKLLLLLVALHSTKPFAADSEFEQFKRQFNQQSSQYSEQQLSEFNQYKQNLRNEFEAYKKEISKKWGYAEVPTDKKLVVYSKDKNQKVVINYAENNVNVATTSAKDLGKAYELLNQVLQKPISEIQQTSSKQSNNNHTIADSLGISSEQLKKLQSNVKTIEKSNSQNSLKSVINDIERQQNKLEFSASQAPVNTLENSDRNYIKQLEREKQQLKKQAAKPTTQQIKQVTKQVSFNPNRWHRTKPYREYVDTQARKYRLPAYLLYAIIETESSFNPQAQSPIPAFGLMQVVPTSAGIDVNHELYRTKRPPRKSTLFNPQTNILFGATYVNLLMNRYFKGVKNDTNRLYVSVAAYNTGPGNVSKLFDPTGGKNLTRAARQINTQSNQKVYQTIYRQAHPETRGYIKKVTSAMGYYKTFIK